MWERVVSAYEKAGLSEAEAITQARVARILRASDYDFVNKSVKLWSPNYAD
jgi:DNA polymerase-1